MALAVALIVFGMIAIFSIGAPFLLTGLVMLVCSPWRRRRDILFPALAAVGGLTLGYLLVAPLGCMSSSAPGAASSGTTVCNGVLLDYSGGGVYNPPLLPALAVGLVTGAVAAVVVRALVSNRSSRDRPLPPTGDERLLPS
jgi:hypothetical protein